MRSSLRALPLATSFPEAARRSGTRAADPPAQYFLSAPVLLHGRYRESWC